jgi:hypothetical protein
MGFDSYSPQSQLMHCSKQSHVGGRRLPAMSDQRPIEQTTISNQRSRSRVALYRITLIEG